MANAVFPKFKENLLAGNANFSLSAAVVKVAACNSYTYDAADVYISDTNLSASAKVFTSTALTGKTFTNGTFDAADKTLTSVAASASSTISSLVVYISNGGSASNALVCYIDTGTGVPVTPNGGDIIITWNASGIFSL